MDKFTHLHLHTEYSLLDGATRIDRLFDMCKKLNMTSVAITDHGNMYGAYDFYCKAKGTGVKPIIGCELYIVEDMYLKSGKVTQEFNHLVLLAKNNIGYKNLVKLDSLAFVDGFYYKPRIDFALLSKHSEGIICLSACLAGELPRLILANRFDDAVELARKYKDLFGEDYYIEIQDHGIAEQKFVNGHLIDIAQRLNIELVATNDVHYLRREDAETQDILMCVQMARFYDETDRMKFTGTEFFLKSYEEMEELFGNVPRALSNTQVIADKCNIKIERQQLLPNYIPSNGMTPDDYLRYLVDNGLRDRYGIVTKEIRERADYELDVIIKMGFVEYFLIVWDFINYSERQGIPVGPGRGSGAGSIVAYSIGITKVEPLRFALLFERFLNPERVSMPDFDIDFCFDRRGEVIEYVIEKYGSSKVAQIVTFGTMAAKAAIKDVARVLRVPYADVEKITKLIPPGKVSLKELFGLAKGKDGDVSIAELKQTYEGDESMRRVIDIAIALEGTPRNTSKHAAGVVICKDDISDHVPLQRNGEDITTQYNMKEVEKLGLLKMDFLGLRTLTDISKAIAIIKQSTGDIVDFSKDNLDDPQVFELISTGDTDAVFQLESAGMKKLMRDLQPTCLEDIIAGISLFRPGPMASIGDYVQGKRNIESVKYKHILLEPILGVTYGCMVYQEQVMQIVRDLGGFSFGQADIIRRAMSKKDDKEMAAQRKYFIFGKKDENGNVIIEGALSRGVDEVAANAIFDEMSIFAEYAFNKSHAAAYAVISYQTAFLKKYYVVEYLAAVLNNRITNIDEIKKYIGYCMSRDIKVLPPDINKSQGDFSVDNKQIRFGLCAVKNVGTNAIDGIIKERQTNGDFADMQDFLTRVDSAYLNKRLVESLIKAGAFDCFKVNRSQLMACFDNMMDVIGKDKKQRDSNQFSLFDIISEAKISYKLPDIPEYNSKYKLGLEKEVLGIYVSGNPLDEYRDKLNTFSFNTSQVIMEVDADDEKAVEEKRLNNELFNKKTVSMGGILTSLSRITTRNNRAMGYGRLEDLYGGLELVFYPKVFEKYKNLLEEDILISVSGSLSIDSEDRAKIFVDRMEVWNTQAQAPKEKVNVNSSKLYLKMSKDDELYLQIIGVVKNYVGDTDVIFVIDGCAMKCPTKVRQCNGLMLELGDILGDENVKLVNKGAE